MTEQPALFGDLLPTLPGCVSGIVGQDDSGKRTVWTLQCAECFALEETAHLVLMKTKFIRCRNVPTEHRMCQNCREKHYRDCDKTHR